MNKEQVRNLRKVQKMLMKLTPQEQAEFDMQSICTCAWGTAIEKHLFNGGATSWSNATLETKELLGFDKVELQFVFQLSSIPNACGYYTEACEIPEHPECLYDNPEGPLAIAECIDRIENVICGLAEA